MAARVYRNAKGERVPSVTTILGVWGNNKQALIYWAWKQGDAGIPLHEKPEADIGTIAHAMIDADIKGKDIDLEQYPVEQVEQAQQCFANWETWKDQHNFRPFESEISLVSEEYQFGGTIDNVSFIDNKLSICDIKTGKEVYEDAIVQIGAYRVLWDENFPDFPITGGSHLLRLGKEIAMFSYNFYQEFPGAWDAFLHLWALYDLGKEIKKLK